MSFSLANQFLIAMPGMHDPNFSRSVTLICEHNEQGALGFVINNPIDMTVGELFTQQNIPFSPDNKISQQPLYIGGPVESERGFILHSPENSWESTMKVDDSFGVTTSRDILEDSASGAGPEKALFILGYAGWGAGQLENELSDNAWLTTPADPEIVFDLPVEQRWRAAAGKIGIDLDLMNANPGHA